MDLALELGQTAGGLSRSMTESELGEWQRYAGRRMLPTRRLELYLAQIALFVVKAAGGGKNATLSDFLFDATADEEADELDADDVAAFFGGTVIRKKGA